MLKRNLLVTAIAVAAAGATIEAQADDAFESAVRKCTAIEDDGARLTCFDALASVVPAVVIEAEPVPEAPAPVAEVEVAEVEVADDAVAAGAAIFAGAGIAAATSDDGASAAAATADDAESAATAVQDDVQPLTDDVGKERIDPSTRENTEYSARVVRCERSQQSGQTYFYLDNEQVWKQANYRRMSFGDCDFEVIISKDGFGYQISIPSKDRTVRVSRIR